MLGHRKWMQFLFLISNVSSSDLSVLFFQTGKCKYRENSFAFSNAAADSSQSSSVHYSLPMILFDVIQSRVFKRLPPPPLAQQPNSGQGRLIAEVPRLHTTHWHTTVGKSSLDGWSARRRDLHRTTHNTQKTDIHASGGIRTLNSSKRSAVPSP
jgi:hypothetical protein